MLLCLVLHCSILPLLTLLDRLSLRNIGEPRSRIISTPDYYPAISEILTLSPNEIQTFTSIAKISTLECSLRESLSQLGEFKKQLGGVLSETAETVKSIEQKLATSETDGQILVLVLEQKLINPVLNLLFFCCLTCKDIMWLGKWTRWFLMSKFTEYFSKKDIPNKIVPTVGRIRNVSSKTSPAT